MAAQGTLQERRPLNSSIPEVLDLLESSKPPPRQMSADISCTAVLHKGIVAGLLDGKVVLLPASDKEAVTVLNPTQTVASKVTCLEVSADGTRLLSGTETGLVQLWNIETQEEVCSWRQSASISAVAFCSGGELFAIGDSSGFLQVLNQNEKLGEWQGSTAISYLAVVEDYIIASFAEETVVLCFNLPSLSEPSIVRVEERVQSIFSIIPDCYVITTEQYIIGMSLMNEDFRIFVSATLPPILSKSNLQLLLAIDNQVFGLSLGSNNMEQLYTHVKKILCLSATSDGQLVLSAGADHTIVVYSLSNKQMVVTILEPELTIERLVITENCRHFALCAGKEIHYRTLEERHLPMDRLGSAGRTLAVSKNGCTGLIRLARGDFYMIDLMEGVWKQLGGGIKTDFDAEFVKMSGTAPREKLRPEAEAEYLLSSGHFFHTSCLVLSPDGSLAAAGEDSSVLVWDLATDSQKAMLTGHSDKVSCLDISPDGKWVVSGSLDQTLMVWDFTLMKSTAALTGHSQAIICVAITSDSTKCVSGAKDFTANVWALASGRLLATLSEHTGPVR